MEGVIQMSEERAKYNTSTIAEMTNCIILANFEKDFQFRETSYQSEAELERQMIENLVSQGYERLIVKSNDDLYINLKNQIEKSNEVSFSDEEWTIFLNEYLDAPNDGMIEKTRKVQENYIHDFIFSYNSFLCPSMRFAKNCRISNLSLDKLLINRS